MSKSIAGKLQEWKQSGIAINDQSSLAQNINLISNSSNGSLSEILHLSFLFWDNFTDGIKSEWSVIAGTWEHNSELDALEVNFCESCSGWKNRIKVDISTPNDILVECKIIELNTLQNTYFDLLNRYSFDSDSGYSIAYMEVYSRLFDTPLFLIRWEGSSRKGYLAEITWAELGLSGVADLEGKTLGIKCEGNVIKGYLDGVEILSGTDDTYSSGHVGLLAQPSTEPFIFDNFKIIQV